MSDVKLDGPRTLTLKPQAIAYILDTLTTRPFKDVHSLINDIMVQLKEQEKDGDNSD